jgi:ATP synthase F0 subunit b
MVIATSYLEGSYLLWWLAQVAAVGILVFLGLRWRPGFLRGNTIGQTMKNALQARADQIQFQLEAAERSRQEAAKIQEEARREIEQARTQAAEIVERAQQTSVAIQRDIETRAQEEADRVVKQAGEEIEYERRQAELALRRRAADIVVDAAGQIVRQNLTPEADRRIIGSSLADLREVG